MAKGNKHMNPEQEPQAELDKSIDPEVLVVQQGEDEGRIAAIETSDAEQIYKPTTDGMAGGEYIPPEQIIEGFPVIGANAENTAREERASEALDINKQLDRFEREAFTPHESKNESFDRAGADAMTAEVSRRAMELVPFASEELKKAVGEQAAANFKAELEAKKGEKQAAADAEAQELLDKLRSGTPISEILPEMPEQPKVDSELSHEDLAA